MPFGLNPTMTIGKPLRAPNVSTAGVHPLVKASMLPRIKRAKAESLSARSAEMARQPKKRSNMSVDMLRSARKLKGRQPGG